MATFSFLSLGIVAHFLHLATVSTALSAQPVCRRPRFPARDAGRSEAEQPKGSGSAGSERWRPCPTGCVVNGGERC